MIRHMVACYGPRANVKGMFSRADSVSEGGEDKADRWVQLRGGELLENIRGFPARGLVPRRSQSGTLIHHRAIIHAAALHQLAEGREYVVLRNGEGHAHAITL